MSESKTVLPDKAGSESKPVEVKGSIYIDGVRAADQAAAIELFKAACLIVVVPCCNYQARANDYPVFWNAHNGVVQCHNCGQVWSPTPTAEREGK